VTPWLRAKIGVLCAATAVASASVEAQSRRAPGVIDGVVTDTALVPLADATVSLLGSAIRVVTNANGRFRIVDLAPGAYILLVRRIGYASTSAAFDVSGNDTLRSSLMLHRAVVDLDTVVVAEKGWASAIEREFEDRRRAGFGHFLTQAQLEKLNFVDLTDALLTVPGVGHDMLNTRIPFLKCRYQFFLDGVPLNDQAVLDALPRPGEVFGVEVYSGPATIPLQFKTFGPSVRPRSGSFCGVILVWSKRGGG